MADLTLQLKAEHLREIILQAQTDYPHEICGIILGKGQTSLEIVPVTNTALSPRTTFEMAPLEILAVFERIDQEDIQLIAFYHSHPSSPPKPSSTDLAQGYYPTTPMLILGKQDSVWTPKAFYLRKDHFIPLALEIIP